MRFHVCSLPHTQTTADFAACAYTSKVRNFCRMMKALGHTVFLYAGTKNEAPADELIPCITEKERRVAVGKGHYTAASFDYSLPHWRKFNATAIAAISKRHEPHDFICLIGGRAHQQIADAFPHPHHQVVEFGIGYGGTFARYRVFESYAWMHVVYGAAGMGNPNAAKGDFWFDAVIPGYLDPDQFPAPFEKDDYFLFVGRLGAGKGEQIAAEVCAALGKRLIVAGQGTPPAGVEYVGVVDPARRAALMSRAKALFAPTTYIEPFGNVAIEAMACGTPVITTDWGAFTETNVEGVTGFRCRTFAEFMQAAKDAETLDPAAIRAHALAHYSLDVIGRKYEAYFERLATLWGEGWYAGRPPSDSAAA